MKIEIDDVIRAWFAARPISDFEFAAIRAQFFVAHPDVEHATTQRIRFWDADIMIAELRKAPQ